MLSKYAKQNWSRYSRNVSLINLWNVAGAPINLKGITRLSNRLNLVLNAVRYSCPSFIRTLLKAKIMSIFKKYFMPYKLFKVPLINGNGYRSFTNMLLIARKSIQSRSPPLGFLTKRIGEAAAEELSRINPFWRFLSSYSFNALSSVRDIEYSSLKGRSLPGISRMS